jgi:hypothetical protein
LASRNDTLKICGVFGRTRIAYPIHGEDVKLFLRVEIYDFNGRRWLLQEIECTLVIGLVLRKFTLAFITAALVTPRPVIRR